MKSREKSKSKICHLEIDDMRWNEERGIFQGYSRPMLREEVIEAFKEKYGYEPDEVEPTGGCWNAGPILELSPEYKRRE